MAKNEEKNVNLPESLTLNGVTYVVKDTPELLAFMQDVAKVEKNKLYSQYETLKSQIEALKGVEVVPEGGTGDFTKLIQQMKDTFVTKDGLQEVLKGTIKEVVQPLIDSNAHQQQNELDAYRTKLINDNLATCIPDLVVGNSKEELDAALAKSIQIRAAYPSPNTEHNDSHVKDPLLQQQANEQRQSPTPSVQAPAAPPATPRREAPEAGAVPSTKKMSMEEFKNQRAALFQELQNTYGGEQPL